MSLYIVPNNQLHVRLTRLMDGMTADVRIARAAIGKGRYSPLTGFTPPARSDTDLETPVVTNTDFTVNRNAEIITVDIIAPVLADDYTVTEFGLFATDGAALILGALAPRVIPARSVPCRLRLILTPQG